MLRPCNLCQISKLTGRDVFAQPTHGAPFTERCSIVKNRKSDARTTVRADSSQSRGFADEFLIENKILLTAKTAASFDDKLEVANIAIRIKSLSPMFDVWGKIDHYEVVGEAWL